MILVKDKRQGRQESQPGFLPPFFCFTGRKFSRFHALVCDGVYIRMYRLMRTFMSAYTYVHGGHHIRMRESDSFWRSRGKAGKI